MWQTSIDKLDVVKIEAMIDKLTCVSKLSGLVDPELILYTEEFGECMCGS